MEVPPELADGLGLREGSPAKYSLHPSFTGSPGCHGVTIRLGHTRKGWRACQIAVSSVLGSFRTSARACAGRASLAQNHRSVPVFRGSGNGWKLGPIGYGSFRFGKTLLHDTILQSGRGFMQRVFLILTYRYAKQRMDPMGSSPRLAYRQRGNKP